MKVLVTGSSGHLSERWSVHRRTRKAASNGAPALGEQGADEQQEQARCGAAVEGGGEVGKPSGQQGG
jgi:hypothetical protein